jgi:hypothetical protein
VLAGSFHAVGAVPARVGALLSLVTDGALGPDPVGGDVGCGGRGAGQGLVASWVRSAEAAGRGAPLARDYPDAPAQHRGAGATPVHRRNTSTPAQHQYWLPNLRTKLNSHSPKLPHDREDFFYGEDFSSA